MHPRMSPQLAIPAPRLRWECPRGQRAGAAAIGGAPPRPPHPVKPPPDASRTRVPTHLVLLAETGDEHTLLPDRRSSSLGRFRCALPPSWCHRAPASPTGQRPASRANSPSAHTPAGAGGRPGSRSATPRRPGSLGWPGEGRPRPPPPCDWPASDNREGQRQGRGSRQHVHQLRGGTTVSRHTREQRPGPCSAGPSVPPSPRPPGMGPDELLTVYPITFNPPPMGTFRRDFDPTRRWLAGGPEGGSEVQKATRPIPTSLDWPLLTLGPASRNLHASPSPSAPRVWGSPSVWVTGDRAGLQDEPRAPQAGTLFTGWPPDGSVSVGLPGNTFRLARGGRRPTTSILTHQNPVKGRRSPASLHVSKDGHPRVVPQLRDHKLWETERHRTSSRALCRGWGLGSPFLGPTRGRLPVSKVRFLEERLGEW